MPQSSKISQIEMVTLINNKASLQNNNKGKGQEAQPASCDSSLPCTFSNKESEVS